MLGYTNVKVFLDGLPEWKKNKKPLLASVKYVKEMSEFANAIVLVDLRDKTTIEAGHIAGAVAVNSATLPSMQEKFPKKKTAPVVIVGADDKEALEAFHVIRGWGYKNASILQGGVKGWQKAGFATATGPAATDIVYTPKPIPGAMSADDFKAILAATSSGSVIVDVRTEEEAQAGAVAGAINIPTDEISDRLAEIPKDKPVITYCSTGIRAEMAYIALKEKGYNVKFLNATTDFADGKTAITEN